MGAHPSSRLPQSASLTLWLAWQSLSWRYECCYEQKKTLHRAEKTSFCPFSLSHCPPLFYEVQTRTLGPTGEGADNCFLYGEWTHSCSKGRTFSNEIFFFPGNENSHPEIIKSWGRITLRKPLNFMAHTLSPCRTLWDLNKGPLMQETLGRRGQSCFFNPLSLSFL